MKTITKSVLSFIAVVSFSFAAKADSLTEKDWTFLLFLNGHNSLSSFGDMNLIDMEKTGSTDRVNYVVQWGKMDDTKTRRLLVKKSNDQTKVTSPTIMSLENNDMGDYKNLIEFVRWGVEKFPAKHYFISVWNHGSGWKRLRVDGNMHISDISYDDNTGNKITTEQLGLAMAESKKIIGHNIDIYGSDACLMQMVEVATEMKDSVDYFVGSQETEPGEGWPYAPFMEKWSAAPSQTPAEISVLLSKEYLKAYSGGVYGNKEVTFSALDVSKLDAFISSSRDLAAHLKSLGVESLKKIKTEAANVQAFYYSDYVDYGDFVNRVKALPIAKESKLFEQANADLKSLVLTTDNSSSFAHATGISIWMPNSDTSDMARYSGLEYSKLSGWDIFLQAMNKTQ